MSDDKKKQSQIAQVIRQHSELRQKMSNQVKKVIAEQPERTSDIIRHWLSDNKRK
ncbi:MAG: hypothetical protein K0U39_05645 [Alphaproteobacteria bacterium]|nr:hypothetical protein [Alphaproteobacteria bacterium]